MNKNEAKESKEDLKATQSNRKIEPEVLENVSETIIPVVRVKKPVLSMPHSYIKKKLKQNSEKIQGVEPEK